MSKKLSKPALVHHKPTGQARVRINGKDHYLGPYGSRQAFDAYDDLIREWLLRQETSRVMLRVDDLCILYVEFATGYYKKGGQETSEVSAIRVALRHLVAKYGTTRIREFGPLALKEVRQSMIDRGYTRCSINQHVHRIRRMFRWGVENELVPAEILTALKSVVGLREGRTEACESEGVVPVSDEVIDATVPHLTTVLQAMVRVQLLTGMRPGEVCSLRPCRITLGTDGVWTCRPDSHKTQHHGKERRISIGPKAQEILRPFLDRDPETFCFTPQESEAKRNAARRSNRKSPMTPLQAARQQKGRTQKLSPAQLKVPLSA